MQHLWSYDSLAVVEDLVRDAVVLAHRQLLILALAVALSIGSHVDPCHAVIVLGQPGVAAGQASWPDLVHRVLVLLPWLQVWGMVLREVSEELGAVREAHLCLPSCKALVVRNVQSTN
eukprot:CAMPEP_0115091786 /NCGR_PEP_ID=MMETSP0227-20121206/26331_1 /TAXON_ID=89957 /ORGANISM="Polarella glacialis, Strain CCMP 1383" /LENGTH=117 /DNA_ID=CAMNT_0002483387 /DNA_START=21 /DNA_END=371 /DNA_ORIENTATION=-